jgi:hypothetical protein
VKKTVLSILLLFTSSAIAAPSPQDYPLTVHVTSSYFRYGGGGGSQILKVVINGKKYKLSTLSNGYLLALGDYKAKLTRDDHKAAYESNQFYEFQFPDNKTRRFYVEGQFE